MTYPNYIEIISDKNKLVLKQLKKESAVYEYVESVSKLGEILELNELQLNKMKSMEIIKTN